MVKAERRHIRMPVVDYRKLRWSNAGSEEFRHLKLLLYWPLFGFLFLFVERIYEVDHYHPIYCPLDDLIPFCEFFVIPYLFWFVFLVGIHLYTLLYDVDAFRKLMKFIMVTYSVTIIIYLLFPNCQELRPASFERDNILTRFMAGFYQFDTNTNVCPSIHVIGSLAAMFAVWDCKRLKHPAWKISAAVAAVLICASTVLLKQHSILDVFAALPVCVAGYLICYRLRRKVERHE